MTPGRSRRTIRSRIEPIAFWALILAAVAMITMNSGCATRTVEWTRTTTTHPDSTVVEENHVVYSNTGFDTSTGLVEVSRDANGNPTLKMENFKGEDMTARTISEGFKAVQAVAGAASGTPN